MATFARAVYAYESAENGDLTFYEGDMIEVLSREGDWWKGKTRDGRIGIFPYNRVEVVPAQRIGNAQSSMVNSVKIRDSGEKVSKVSVELKELKRNKRGHAVFTVRVDLESRDQIIEDKGMTDFRKMDNALKALDPNFEYIHVLPPEWADEIPLSNSQARQRARSLTKYLAHNTNGREVFDLLLLKWVRASANELRGIRGNNNAQLSPSDSKQRVMEKVMAALAKSYQQREVDPLSFFSNSSRQRLVQVRYEWSQRDETEISFSKWEYVLVLQDKTQYDGWWYGQRTKGEKGLFPSNYVTPVEPAELKKMFQGRGGTNNHSSPMMQSPGYAKGDSSRGGTENYRSPGSKQSRNKGGSRIRRSPTSPQAFGGGGGGGRQRKVESGFCVKSIEGYEELTKGGVTMELNGRPFRMKRGSGPQRGDFISAHFNAYVWDPQTQTLREFSSSDRLAAPPKGVTSGEAGASGFKMEFVLGKNEVIDGLEEAISSCEMNKTFRAIISPSKGYGDVGSPPEIPGNCFLVYDLTLEKVSKQSPIDRRKIFSVGISKPNVQLRPQQRAKEYQGLKSIGERQRKRRDRARTQNR